MNVQNLPADALSDILSAINARARCSISLTAGGAWSIGFPNPANLKFNAVRHGSCWLIVPGHAPVRLETGDCLVVSGTAFTLASDPAIAPVSARQIFSTSEMAAAVGDGADFSIIGGSVEMDAIDGALLREALPPFLVVGSAQAISIRWLLDELGREWDSGAAGAQLVCSDLLRMIFVHVLRWYLASGDDGHAGWLGALKHRALARALHAIHREPSRDWSVAELAAIAGQSRSSFAARFKAAVGHSPVDYLTQWRMRLAARRLRGGDVAISVIARELGYASESAFGAAFRRVHDDAPGKYRRVHGAMPDGAKSDAAN